MAEKDSKNKFLTVPNYKKTKDSFVKELISAQNGHKSSLSFIKNRFPKKPLITNGIVQGFVIGGTNYKTVLARITPGGEIEYLQETLIEGILPVFSTADVFLDFFATHFDKRAQAIGINLAFPLSPTIGKFDELDGSIIYGTKAHRFERFLGKPVGEILRKHLNLDIPISVANDTVCLTSFDADGLIAGTGFNIGINIDENGEKMAVNLESAGFTNFEVTKELEIIDAKSPTRGKNRFEKMFSGLYLHEHFNLVAKSKKLNISPLSDGSEVSELAKKDSGMSGNLAREILTRSASFLATAVAGVYEFKGRPKKLVFTTEGSLFWKGYKFEDNVEKQLLEFGIPTNAIEFKYVEDSSLKGALSLLTRAS